MKLFMVGLAVFVAYLLLMGALLLPSADAATTYLAKCQGPTSQYPQKHVIYQTGNGVWKLLDPNRCYPPWQRSGDLFHATYYAGFGWLFSN